MTRKIWKPILLKTRIISLNWQDRKKIMKICSKIIKIFKKPRPRMSKSSKMITRERNRRCKMKSRSLMDSLVCSSKRLWSFSILSRPSKNKKSQSEMSLMNKDSLKLHLKENKFSLRNWRRSNQPKMCKTNNLPIWIWAPKRIKLWLNNLRRTWIITKALQNSPSWN